MSNTSTRCGRKNFPISAACGLAGFIALAALSHIAVAAASDETVGVRSVAFSPDGQWLVATTGEPNQQGTVTFWEVKRRKQLWRHTETSGIPAAAFSPDGRTLAIAVYDKAARLLDAATGQVRATFKHPKEVRSVAFSPDGKRLATACWDGLLRVWDVAAQAEKVTCAGHRSRIFSVAFSPNGKFLLSVAGDDGAKLWDAGSGAEIGVFKHYYMPCAGFTPNGQSVITGSYDGTTRLWDIGTGAIRVRFSGTGGVRQFAFSQAARTLAVCGTGRDISLFSLTFAQPTARELEQIRQLLAKLDDDSYDVREAASKELLEFGFTAEAELRRATSEGVSVEVRIRARRLREQMLSKPLVLCGHTGEVDCVAFSPDGKVLASGAKDGTVRLWDRASRKETACLAPGR